MREINRIRYTNKGKCILKYNKKERKLFERINSLSSKLNSIHDNIHKHNILKSKKKI